MVEVPKHYCDDKSSHVVSCSYQVSVALMALTLNYPHGTPFIRRSEARLPSTCTGMARQLTPMARQKQQHRQTQESADYRSILIIARKRGNSLMKALRPTLGRLSPGHLRTILPYKTRPIDGFLTSSRM